MKYKDIFKKWYFWVICLVYNLFNILAIESIYGNLSIITILTMAIGSVIIMLSIYSIGFFIIKTFVWIIKKVTKR